MMRRRCSACAVAAVVPLAIASSQSRSLPIAPRAFPLQRGRNVFYSSSPPSLDYAPFDLCGGGGVRGYATSHHSTQEGRDTPTNKANEDDIFVKAANTSHFQDGDEEFENAKQPAGAEAEESDVIDEGPAHTLSDRTDAHQQQQSGGGGGAHSGNAVRVNMSPSLRTAYPPSGVELPESSFLKCIEKEIDDEKLRLDKEEGPPPSPPGWELFHAKGSSVFYGRRMWMPPATAPALGTSASFSSLGSESTSEAAADVFPSRHERCMEKHFIRVQLTSRDASLDPECDIRGEHFPFSLFIQRVPLAVSPAPVHAPTFDEAEEMSLYENSIEARLDVVDGELVVDHVVYHGRHALLTSENQQRMKPTRKKQQESSGNLQEKEDEGGNPFCNAKTHRTNPAVATGDEAVVEYNNVFGGYPGPNLDEGEEEVLDGIQSWLAERHIDDRFGEFVGQYSVWVEQAEYEQWLQQLHDYVAA